MSIRKSLYSFGITIFFIGVCSILNNQNVYATMDVHHWQGTNCTSNVDCLWSDAGNWIELSAPTDEDSVVFSTNSTSSYTANNDIEGLTIRGFTIDEKYYYGEDIYTVNYEGVPYDINFTQPITITHTITNETNDPDLNITGDIILGGDVSMRSTSLLTIGLCDLDDCTLDLNGHTLSLVSANPLPEAQTTNQQVAIYSSIIGTSTSSAVTVNNVNGTLVLTGDNTYNGATNITAGTFQNYVQIEGINYSMMNNGIFGNSVVNISDGTMVNLLIDMEGDNGYDSITEINNVINIEGKPVGELEASETGSLINFLFDSSIGSGTLLMPNIVLNGSAVFANWSVLQGDSEQPGIVDLTGIATISEGNVVRFLQYNSEGDVYSLTDNAPLAGFIYTDLVSGSDIDDSNIDVEVNGEEEANDDTAPVITAPNTAIRSFITSNPIIVAVLGLASAIMIIGYARAHSSRR